MATKQDVRGLHRKTLVENGNNNVYSDILLEAIGGIDNVLEHLLLKETNFLGDKQLIQIQQILSTPTKHKQKDKLTAPKDNQENDPLHPEIAIYLNTNNSFLHSIFDDIIANKIRKYLYHVITWIVVVLLFIISNVLVFMKVKFHYIFGLIYYGFILLPWTIFVFLSLNRAAAKRIVPTFEFIIKTGYATVFMVTTALYYMLFVNKGTVLNPLNIVHDIMFSLSTIFCIICVAMFDGNLWIQNHKLLAILALCGTSWVYIFISIYFQFSSYSKEGTDESIVRIFGGMHISLISTISHSSRIVGLFLFKQCYLLYKSYKRKINHATSIRISPNIEWNSVALGTLNKNMKQTTYNDEEMEIKTVNVPPNKVDGNFTDIQIKETNEIEIETVMTKRKNKESESISTQYNNSSSIKL
eukprot:118688_1